MLLVLLLLLWLLPLLRAWLMLCWRSSCQMDRTQH